MENFDFEAELTLVQLLPERIMQSVANALNNMGISPVGFADSDGQTLWGETSTQKPSLALPIAPELDIIGYLQIYQTIDETLAKGIQALLLILAQSQWRYLMASDLHLKAIQADYRALQEEHKKLLLSEQKYRELSEQLEQKVEGQVATIENAQRKLFEVETLAAVGQLAAGVAHEVNNPIGFINSNLRAAQLYVEDLAHWYLKLPQSEKSAEIDELVEDFPALLDESISGGKRVAAIVADLKAYSAIDCNERHPVDLKEILERVVRIFSSLHQKEITFTLKVEPGLLLICHPGRINQLFLNLLTNSANAIESKGEVILRATAEDRNITLEIIDNGCGMDPQTLSKAFKPFFTTRDVGKGTGLGLTVARDIVLEQGGEIALESTPGQGTRVILTLKRQD